MAKVLNHGNRKEKGLTLVEVVIALGIVVTVSLATVSIVVYSSSSLQSSARKSFFQHEIDTFADLYLSYDGENYQNAMRTYTGETVSTETDHTFYYDAAYRYSEASTAAYYTVLDFEGNNLHLSAYKIDGTTILKKDITK